MEITPQHLGEKWRVALLKRRALARVRQRMGYVVVGDETTYDEPKRRPRSTHLQRFWLRAANLRSTEVAEIAPLLTKENAGVSVWRNFVATFTITVIWWFMSACAIAILKGVDYEWASLYESIFSLVSLLTPVTWLAWATQAALFAPRRALRNINTDAVAASEIEAFLPTVRGDLDRSYLNTVLDAIRQPIPDAAGQHLRNALREVGDTVSALPGEPFPAGLTDPENLRQTAQMLQGKAAHEPDSILQASLLRQTDAMEKQAHVMDGAAKTARRARARYDEAAANLSVLRAVLMTHAADETAARLSVQGDIAPFAVREAATGAVSVTEASRELDDSERAALYGQPIPEPARQAVGGNTAPRPVGKWWQ